MVSQSDLIIVMMFYSAQMSPLNEEFIDGSSVYNTSKQIQQVDLKEISMEWRDRIVIDPEILVGKPIIKGTRLAVAFIIDLLAQGWTEEDILHNYPGLSGKDIKACLSYASEILKVEKVYAFPVAGE